MNSKRQWPGWVKGKSSMREWRWRLQLQPRVISEVVKAETDEYTDRMDYKEVYCMVCRLYVEGKMNSNRMKVGIDESRI